MAANEVYDEKQATVRGLLAQLAEQLDGHAQVQAGRPSDWGFVGDDASLTAHVEERLRELRGFLLPVTEVQDVVGN